jgi:DNA polymerase-3 subunit epsilon
VLVAPIQSTLDLGVPLSEVTFCVVDLETTGGSPIDARITEIGGVKLRGGERLGTFASLVNPATTVPPFITHLTGIDDQMLAGEPPIEHVLPSLVEFLAGSVFVAHNARFDHSFLNVALERAGYAPIPGPPICTARLARRIVWPEVPNVRLMTLAKYFRTRVQPEHRAFADAQATAEVLTGLLDLGARLGISTLGDLGEAVRARGRPHFGKIAMADSLPHATGVYLFRSRDGRVLYVGKSKDLRSRVKSYFYGDERKKVDALLSEVHHVEGITCPSGELEALVVEARLIRRHEPKYNRRGTTWRRGVYLKIDPSEAYPRVKVVRRSPPGDGCAYLGPFSTAKSARLAKEALEEVFPLRRCTRSMGVRTRFAPCALADIGRCVAPCDGRVGPERYGELVRELISSLSAPDGLLGALESRMTALAGAERFEEAALVRDRARALAGSLSWARRDRWLLGTSFVVRDSAGCELCLDRGSLRVSTGGPAAGPMPQPPPRERADELAAVRSWLARNPVTLLASDAPLFEPVDGGAALRRLLDRLRASELGGAHGEIVAPGRAPDARARGFRDRRID